MYRRASHPDSAEMSRPRATSRRLNNEMPAVSREGRKKTPAAKPNTTVDAKPTKPRGFYNILGDALFGRPETERSKRKQRPRKTSSGSDIPAREQLSTAERMKQKEEDAMRYLYMSRKREEDSLRYPHNSRTATRSGYT